ncbi:VPLPA-CTERM sorting domain-containing protein [Yoonia sp.]|uniref:VPLPA-CTERM sorting domain-containing protein n=1 Tax=Yoonia sp. TaxID=2212373 RepID=UPI0025FB1DC6|nr:VPLPA-CTERM sorting domain-containing protein [Yoonia sp.]
MLNAKSLLCVAALAFGGASAVQATTITWASSVTDSRDGATVTATSTGGSDAAGNALGADDGKSFGIGQGGVALFGFDAAFANEVTLVEGTKGNRSRQEKTVDIYVGLLADYIFGSFDLRLFTYVGTITNASEVTRVALPFGSFDTLALQDIVPAGPVRPNNRVGGPASNGWNVDAIGVMPTPVPLPAGGLLLVGALGGLAALRRRRKPV